MNMKFVYYNDIVNYFWGSSVHVHVHIIIIDKIKIIQFK